MQNFEMIGAGEQFKSELYDMISGITLFSDLGSSEMQQLASYLQAYRAPAGSVIFSEGEPASYICVLQSGAVDIVKDDARGESKTVATVGAGKTLGEMAVVDGEPRSATCVAKKDCVLLLLTRENFQRIVHHYPGLAVKLLVVIAKLLSQRLRQASGVLVDYLDG